MKNMQRALRRHHAARLKAARAHWHWGRSLQGNAQALGKVVNTPCHCSCWQCGNPRRHRKEPSAAERSLAELTLAEQAKHGQSTWQLRGNCAASTRQLRGKYEANTRQVRGKYEASTRQVRGKYEASTRQVRGAHTAKNPKTPTTSPHAPSQPFMPCNPHKHCF